MKVTDTLNVGFKVSPGYKFVRWEAVQKSDETVSMSDYVEFEDETALETNVKLLKKSNDLLIKPLCELSMDFTSCIPVNNTKSGIERNSQIELTFTNLLSTENDVSKIQILIEDDTDEAKSGALYFQTPIITENKILIKSIKDNLIPVKQGELKTVTIIIPEDFKYIGANAEEKLIGFEMSYSYTVNYQTCDKLHVVFGVSSDDGGKFKVQNIYDESISLTYSLGQVDTIIFRPSKDYRFIGWDYLADGHFIIDEKLNDDINEMTYVDGYCEEDNSYAARIEIFNSSNSDTNFYFRAQVEKIPTADIFISSPYGTISPNGSKKYKEGEKESLIFYANSDYQFVKWRLVNKNTREEIENQNYVIFEKEEECITNFLFNKVNPGVEFLIEPYCVRRPNSITKLPVYDSAGVNKDRKIMVMFDKKMDANSIYFSDEELISAGVLDSDGNLVEGYALLKATAKTDYEGRIYGYYKTDDDNSYVYKNIKISKRNNLSENLLKHYSEPYFDEFDSSILRIGVNSDNVPPGATDIFVELGDFYFVDSVTEKKIVIPVNSTDRSWPYYTNGDIDNSAPTAISGFKMQIDTASAEFISVKTTYDGFASPDKFLESKSGDSFNRMIEHNCKGKKVHFEGTFNDDSSGVSYVKWHLYKIDSTYYKEETISKELANGQLIKGKDFIVDNLNANIKEGGITIDLENSIKTQGMYMFRLVVGDNNDNTLDNKYYFIYDETKPGTVENLKESRTKSGKATISWNQIPEYDIKKMTLKAINIEDETKNKDFDIEDKKSTSIEIDVVDGNHYKYELELTDTMEQSQKTSLAEDRTPPVKLKMNYSEGRNGRIKVYFTTPNDEDYYKTTVSFGTSSSTQWDVEEANGRNKSTSRTFYDGVNGTTYYYYFRTYDYSGNCSELSFEEMAGAMPGMICYAPGNTAGNIFCSKNYWPGKNPIGIVADGSNQEKVKILALDQSKEAEYFYGPNDGNFCADNAYYEKRGDIPVYVYRNGKNVANGTVYYNNQEGLEWYKLVRDTNYRGNMVTGSIWDYLYNVKNKNSAVTWWVPARHEWQFVALNWRPMCSAFETILAGGGSATTITDKAAYYVSTPNYYNNRCNFVGINYNDNGHMNECIAIGEWMTMYTTSYKQDVYYRTQKYGKAYVRAMAYVNMN